MILIGIANFFNLDLNLIQVVVKKGWLNGRSNFYDPYDFINNCLCWNQTGVNVYKDGKQNFGCTTLFYETAGIVQER